MKPNFGEQTDQFGSSQRAVWRNGGSNPADSSVRNCKAVPRRNISGSRHFAKPPVSGNAWATVRADNEVEN